MLSRSAPIVLLAALALAPSAVLAKDAVVSPLVSKGVDPLVVLNLTSLIASELDFMGTYGSVKQLDKMPPEMNADCLKNGACMTKVATNNGGQVTLGGSVALVGNKLDLTLVLAEGGRIVHTNRYAVPNQASVIADSMSTYVKEVVTGTNTAQVAAEDKTDEIAAGTSGGMFDGEEEDDMPVAAPVAKRPIATPSGNRAELMDEEDPEEAAEKAAAAKKAAAAEQARKAEEARRAEEERKAAAAAAARRAEEERQAAARQAEEDRKAAVAAAAAKKAEDQRRAAAAAAAASEEDEGGEEVVISRSKGVTMVIDDPDAGEYEEEEAPPPKPVATKPKPKPTYEDESPPVRRPPPPADEEEDYEDSRSTARGGYDDNEDDPDFEERPKPKPKATDYDEDERPTAKSGGKKTKGNLPASGVTARLGFHKFQSLNFVTYGGEARYVSPSRVAAVGGMEFQSVKRQIPEALWVPGQPIEEWNTITVLNFGVQYLFGKEKVHPFIGADAVLIPGFVDEEGGGMVGGVRFRGGLDIMAAEHFGISLNAGLGYLGGGDQLSQVDKGFQSSAASPAINLGTLFTF